MDDLELIFPERKPADKKKAVAGEPVRKRKLTSPKRKSVQTSKKENMQTSKHVNKFADKQAYVDEFLEKKAIVSASFRLPPEIMEKFDEVYYLCKSKYRTDFKRYSIAVTALAALFWDFEENGKSSDLYKLLIEVNKKTNK